LIRDYSREIEEYWPVIEKAWEEHGKKNAIIECDLARSHSDNRVLQSYLFPKTRRRRK